MRPACWMRGAECFTSTFGVCEDVRILNNLCAVSRRVGVLLQPLGVNLIHAASIVCAAPLQDQQYNVQTLLVLKRFASNFFRTGQTWRACPIVEWPLESC